MLNNSLVLKDEYKETLQGKITIPTKFNNKDVISIGKFGKGFGTNSKITHIYFLADSKVNTIGDSAFADCYNLKKVELPDTVRIIESSAFTRSEKLESVNLNDNITAIKGNAFSGCESLQLNKLPDKLVELGQSAFT